MSVGLTDNLRPLRAEAYLVSTFRLEPEHFHLTTGTFNLIVKDRIASRLSGAPSVRTNPRHRRESVRPRNLSKLRAGANPVNPLKQQDFHLFSTSSGEAQSIVWRTYDTRRNALPLPKPSQVRHRPKRKTMNSSKIAWRFCFSRNPSGNLVPECGPRDPGSNGGLLNWMPPAAETMHRRT